MRYLYTPLLYLLFPYLLVRLLARGFRNPAYWHRWRERLGYGALAGPVDLWLHAVSVGEVRAAAPLLEALLERGLVKRVVVTIMTPTGSDQVAQLFGERVLHSYAPYDYPGAVIRFLNRLRPDWVLIMETEIWPNIIHQCHRRDIPVAFANLRLSERSYRRYALVDGLLHWALAKVSGFAIQSEPDAARLRRLGAASAAVQVTGSIKFEVDIPASLAEVAQVLRREWGQGRPVWIAGSTHDGEEQHLLDTHAALRSSFPDLLLVLVPRHPERFTPVTRLAQRAGHRVVRRSESRGDLDPAVAVYVGDTMGELTLLYAAADIAFVGGSLVPAGGHNILEPCALGLPVVFGPHMFNFLQISELALEREAGHQVEDAAQLVHVLDQLLRDPNLRFKAGEAGRELVAENRGALARTLAMLVARVPTLAQQQGPVAG